LIIVAAYKTLVSL